MRAAGAVEASRRAVGIDLMNGPDEPVAERAGNAKPRREERELRARRSTGRRRDGPRCEAIEALRPVDVEVAHVPSMGEQPAKAQRRLRPPRDPGGGERPVEQVEVRDSCPAWRATRSTATAPKARSGPRSIASTSNDLRRPAGYSGRRRVRLRSEGEDAHPHRDAGSTRVATAVIGSLLRGSMAVLAFVLRRGKHRAWRRRDAEAARQRSETSRS